jgi:hypothetical protein
MGCYIKRDRNRIRDLIYMSTNIRPLSGINSPLRRIYFPIIFSFLSASPIKRNLSSDNDTVQIKDLILSRSFSGFEVTDYQMALNTFGGSSPSNPVWNSSSPSIATVDQTGYVEHQSTGSVIISVSVNNEPIASSSLTMVESFEPFTSTLAGYVSGSLSYEAASAVDNRILNKNPSSSLLIFTTQNHTAPLYVRNTASWCYDVDLTSISPWNSTDGVRRAGTLISPRHILFAWHYQPATNATFRFVTTENEVITRTMTNKMSIPSASLANDITIGILDSDVPTGSIGFAKVLPPDWRNYLPSLSQAATLPALCLDQEEKALITDLRDAATTGSANFVIPNNLNWENRIQYHENKISGDSGNPAFLIINNELVLLTVWTFGGAGSGTFVTPLIDQINSVMSSLGGGYQLTTASLSGSFTYYP